VVKRAIFNPGFMDPLYGTAKNGLLAILVNKADLPLGLGCPLTRSGRNNLFN